MSKTDGGPAFPCEGPFNSVVKNTVFAYPGVTVRDFFATHALVSMGQWTPCEDDGSYPADQDGVMSCKAKWAYDMADAMLSARDA